jgi:LytS/YehU family sensor histidine kinase
MFELDIQKVKTEISKKIRTNLDKIDRELLSTLNTELKENYEQKEEILEVLTDEPNTIEKYIKLIDYVRD